MSNGSLARQCTAANSRILIVSICALLPALAQTPPEVRIRSAAWFPPDMVISTNADLVELAATVRDGKGRPIGGLRADDFEILDNNQPRQVTFFLEQTRLQRRGPDRIAAERAGAPSPPVQSERQPESRSIALFFDDAHASMAGIRKSAEAAERLLTEVLLPDDVVGIFTSSGTVAVDFTVDHKILLAALSRLEAHPLPGVRSTVPCPTLGPSEAYIVAEHLDIAIEDAAVGEMVGCYCFDPRQIRECTFAQRAAVQSVAATIWHHYEYQSTTTLDVLLIVVRHLAAARGEKMLILMSPGFPTGGMEDRTSALTDAALRANVRISAVNSEGLLTDRKLVRELFLLSVFMADAAKATGGKYLHNTNDWAGALRNFVAVPEVSYVLGFSPGNPDGKYHSLKTRIPGTRGYKVESRAGYYAASSPDTKLETAQQRIDRIAMSDEDIRDFPAALEVRQGATVLNVTISVDAGALQFPEKEGRRLQELTFLTLLEDMQGNFVAGKQSVMDTVLTSATFAELRAKGIRASASFPLPRPGLYRVRQVVREVAQNHIWASAEPIEVH